MKGVDTLRGYATRLVATVKRASQRLRSSVDKVRQTVRREITNAILWTLYQTIMLSSLLGHTVVTAYRYITTAAKGGRDSIYIGVQYTRHYGWIAALYVFEKLWLARKATARLLTHIVNALMRGYDYVLILVERAREAKADSPEADLSTRLDSLSFVLFGKLWKNESRYDSFQKSVKQARLGVDWDIYLSRSLFYSLTIGAIGAVLGVVLAFAAAPYLINYDYNILLPLAIYNFLQAHAVKIVVIAITTFFGAVSFAASASVFYYYPSYVAGERGRSIDNTLPHAITFMYAMSRGGMNVLEVVREIAEAEDTYGEVSEEFQSIVKNVERKNVDLQTALRQGARATPSNEFRQFLEDFINIVDSGSNPEAFFSSKGDAALDSAVEEQRNMLEIFEMVNQMYVILFVVSPIFLLIIQMVMGMMGSSDMPMLNGMTYLGLPFGGALFAGIILMLSSSNEMDEFQLDVSNGGETSYYDEEAAQNDPRHTSFKWTTRITESADTLKNPFGALRRQPLYSLLFTIPAAGLFVTYMVYAGMIEASLEVFDQQRIWATLVYIYGPICIIAIPLSVLYELSKRREKAVITRLHDLFETAAEANDRGLTLEESIRMATKNSNDTLAKELEKAMNRASWTGDISGSLSRFANTMRVPRLSRTIKLVAKANASSGDVKAVLHVASDDLKNMYQLDKEQKQQAFITIVTIGLAFIISIGIIVMLDLKFLTVVEEQIATGGGGGDMEGAGFGGGIPIMEFRRIFLHTTMSLGASSGIVIGVMTETDPMSGIKYSLLLMTIPLIVFAVV